LSIRVTRVGLISLVFGMINVIIGFGFSLILIRNLSVIEFGTWGLIVGIIAYATIIEPIITFWSTREIARNVESGRTAVLSSFLISTIAMAIYFISAFTISELHFEQNIILLGSVLVPVIILKKVLDSICLGWKPQGVSYGQIIFGIVQIIMAFILIYVLEKGVSGVILTVITAHSVNIIFFIIYNKERLQNSIQKRFLIKWIKLSWIPIYPVAGSIILSLDIVIFSIITKSVIGVAFWTVSLMLVQIISNAGLISRATYPKLLQGNNNKFLQDNLRHLIYFAILFSAIVITFAKPGLHVLNPEYVVVEYIVIILAVRAFFKIITKNILMFISAKDMIDINEKSSFLDYIKSRIIRVSTIEIISSISYIVILATILLMIISGIESQLELVLYWALIILIIQVPTSLYSIIYFRKEFLIKIEIQSIVKYLVAAIISFGLSRILLDMVLEYDLELIKFLPQILLFIMLSIGMYIGITAIIDIKTRNLINAVVLEIKNRI
jgi:hypothetical protein